MATRKSKVIYVAYVKFPLDSAGWKECPRTLPTHRVCAFRAALGFTLPGTLENLDRKDLTVFLENDYSSSMCARMFVCACVRVCMCREDLTSR